MVSGTWTIEWHTRQPIPAWASGVVICSRIGVSIRPVRRIAMSWQPPHHLDGEVPTTSCMYSTDFRYHWLLNEEKWCAEESHWAVMSGWHPLFPHFLDSRKKSAGITPSGRVRLDEGKKGLPLPAPSSSWVARR